MAFLKLDCAILRSSIWVERERRSLFLTALLMAEPYEVREPTPQLEVRSLNETGFLVPPGWYGMIRAAGVGIIRMDGMEQEEGLQELEALGSPDKESRSQDFDGRRLVRVDGGYLALNFMKYRDHDHTAAERQKRLRDRRRALDVVRDNADSVTRDGEGVTRDVALQSQIAEGREQKAEGRDVVKKSRVKSGVRSYPNTPRAPKPNGTPPAPPSVDGETPATTADSAPTVSSTVQRFQVRFYGQQPAQRRQDIAEQVIRALSGQGVRYKGDLVRAVDGDHLDGACQQVMEDPPRDPNAAWVWVLLKLKETYAEVHSARFKAGEPRRSASVPGLAGDAPAGATDLRAAIAGVLDGLDR